MKLYSRSYLELDILETTLLPSDVIRIKFYRPPNYKFLSGSNFSFFLKKSSLKFYNFYVLCEFSDFKNILLIYESHGTWIKTIQLIYMYVYYTYVCSVLGQYIKVSCTAIQPEEFHSLTITSAPHEGSIFKFIYFCGNSFIYSFLW